MKTLLEIKTEVIDDLDLQDSDLINDVDITRWTNKAIRKAQADIVGINESYFLSYFESPITVSDLYDYPPDIYANKIKSIVLTKNSYTSYRLDRIKNMDKATYMINTISSQGSYGGWIPLNTVVGGRKMQLIPNPESGILKIWYIRNSKQLSLDTDVCDIDEFEDYIISQVKTLALRKDSNPMYAEAKQEETEYRRLMIETLEDMIITDNDNKLEADMSFYKEEM